MAQRFLRSLWGRRDRSEEHEAAGGAERIAPGADAGPGADQCALRLTVLGCGDAFGSGGRLQSSYHVEAPQGTFLLDCGVTALIGMQRLRLDPNAVGCILVSHLHGDHFGGLVWWLLHSHYASNRTGPLTIAGPAGIRERVHAAAEAMFPGSAALELRYRLEYREFVNRAPLAIGGLAVTPFEARHPSGAPAHALRIETGGRCLSFSGDTEWVEDLVPCAKGADLFIIDCFGWDSDIGSHMSWKTISSRLDALVARRLMLTHMGPEMLARLGEVRDPRFLAAEDGLVVELSGESGARAPVGA